MPKIHKQKKYTKHVGSGPITRSRSKTVPPTAQKSKGSTSKNQKKKPDDILKAPNNREERLKRRTEIKQQTENEKANVGQKRLRVSPILEGLQNQDEQSNTGQEELRDIPSLGLQNQDEQPNTGQEELRDIQSLGLQNQNEQPITDQEELRVFPPEVVQPITGQEGLRDKPPLALQNETRVRRRKRRSTRKLSACVDFKTDQSLCLGENMKIDGIPICLWKKRNREDPATCRLNSYKFWKNPQGEIVRVDKQLQAERRRLKRLNGNQPKRTPKTTQKQKKSRPTDPVEVIRELKRQDIDVGTRVKFKTINDNGEGEREDKRDLYVFMGIKTESKNYVLFHVLDNNDNQNNYQILELKFSRTKLVAHNDSTLKFYHNDSVNILSEVAFKECNKEKKERYIVIKKTPLKFYRTNNYEFDLNKNSFEKVACEKDHDDENSKELNSNRTDLLKYLTKKGIKVGTRITFQTDDNEVYKNANYYVFLGVDLGTQFYRIGRLVPHGNGEDIEYKYSQIVLNAEKTSLNKHNNPNYIRKKLAKDESDYLLKTIDYTNENNKKERGIILEVSSEKYKIYKIVKKKLYYSNDQEVEIDRTRFKERKRSEKKRVNLPKDNLSNEIAYLKRKKINVGTRVKFYNNNDDGPQYHDDVNYIFLGLQMDNDKALCYLGLMGSRKMDVLELNIKEISIHKHHDQQAANSRHHKVLDLVTYLDYDGTLKNGIIAKIINKHSFEIYQVNNMYYNHAQTTIEKKEIDAANLIKKGIKIGSVVKYEYFDSTSITHSRQQDDNPVSLRFIGLKRGGDGDDDDDNYVFVAMSNAESNNITLNDNDVTEHPVDISQIKKSKPIKTRSHVFQIVSYYNKGKNGEMEGILLQPPDENGNYIIFDISDREILGMMYKKENFLKKNVSDSPIKTKLRSQTKHRRPRPSTNKGTAKQTKNAENVESVEYVESVGGLDNFY